jgi:hypothetical protein
MSRATVDFTTFLERYHAAPTAEPAPPPWPHWPTYRSWEALRATAADPRQSFASWLRGHYDPPIARVWLTLLTDDSPPPTHRYYEIRQADALWRWMTHPASAPWQTALAHTLEAPRWHTLARHWQTQRFPQAFAQQLKSIWEHHVVGTHTRTPIAFDDLENHALSSPTAPTRENTDAVAVIEVVEASPAPAVAHSLITEPPPSDPSQAPVAHASVPTASMPTPVQAWLATWDGLDPYHPIAVWLDTLAHGLRDLDPTCDPATVLPAWLATILPSTPMLDAWWTLWHLDPPQWPPAV